MSSKSNSCTNEHEWELSCLTGSKPWGVRLLYNGTVTSMYHEPSIDQELCMLSLIFPTPLPVFLFSVKLNVLSKITQVVNNRDRVQSKVYFFQCSILSTLLRCLLTALQKSVPSIPSANENCFSTHQEAEFGITLINRSNESIKKCFLMMKKNQKTFRVTEKQQTSLIP